MIKEKLKLFLRDSAWSIAGLILMNAIAQLMIYPLWSNTMGTEQYGTIIYLMSVANIAAGSFGSACSYTRIMQSAENPTTNSIYLRIMVLSGIISAVTGAIFCYGTEQNPINVIAYVILSVCITWRYYADVEFRLYLNYKGYFLYYLLISIGYCLGALLMKLTGIWALALLTGEIFGLGYVYGKGHIFRKDTPIPEDEAIAVQRLFLILFGSYFLNSLVFNADRILLKHTVGNTAVSVYYVASLFGKTLSLITTPFNAVISGYLARMKQKLTKNIIVLMNISALLLAIAMAFLCTIGAYLVIPVLYPDIFPMAKPVFFIANLAQTIYFATNIISVVMLRFANQKHQILSNLVYTAVFIVICIPVTYFKGLWGFYISFLLTSFSRMLYDMIILLRISKRSIV